MNTSPARLAIVERSPMFPPREFSQLNRSTSATSSTSSNAAYRRLTAVILSLDVATLAAELSASRHQTAHINRSAA